MSEKLAETKSPAMAVVVVARLNARLQPMHRGEIYEDPLAGVLEEQGLGEVTGGGTQLGADNEIEFCDIEIVLPDESETTLAAVTGALEKLGAPKGSKLLVESTGREVSFGVAEGLAVYLNGTDLPAEVYQTSDVNVVYQEFNRLLEPDGAIQSYWEGPRETGLYMYGRSFAAMKDRLADFIASYPLCQRARVVRIA